MFHVCPSGGCAHTVTLTGMTIRKGSVGGPVGSGGGIYNRATLNIQNCTIGGAAVGNTATNYGGSIYHLSGTVTVAASTVSANQADQGGGIYSAVDGSTVSANAGTDGCGIYNRATLHIQNGSTIGGAGAGNTATLTGGGILNFSAGSTTVNGSTVSANRADWGGSIFNQATLTIQNGNAIGRAGAGNIADLIGGGIYNYLGSTMTVDASNVSANTADLHAGGIYNQATLTVQNGSTIGGVGIGNRASWDGGGIYNYDGGFAMVTGSRILDNKVTHGNGGGVYSDTDDAEATKVTGSCLVGNSATSFFNFRTAQQVGTGNWWGPRPGPIPLVRIRSVATWTIAAS